MKKNCERPECINKDCDRCFEIASDNWWEKHKRHMKSIDYTLIKMDKVFSDMMSPSKEDKIKAIKERILSEHKKYAKYGEEMDWAEIAARKIYSQWMS